MVKVAVAGGAGKLGLYIVEAIHASKDHTVVVLSRKGSSPSEVLTSLGVETIPVDYTLHDSIVKALAGVHTVISTIAGYNHEQMVDSQIALAKAAVDAGAKRFAPSEFACKGIHNDIMRLYALKPLVVDALRTTPLEWTIFENGLFMNYLATGTPGLGYLAPLKPGIDVENGTAHVPGDGNAPVVLTRVEDIGAFVTASLSLDRWPEVSSMAGDTTTFNKLIKMAEDVRGKKFDVKYVSIEALRASMDPNPAHLMQNFPQEYSIVLAEGVRFGFQANLNKLCPEVKPMGAKEFMEKWWIEKVAN